ncbi:MAG: ABC transporter permease [Chloroflexi bacterium]|nr:ABC transporter permease [Chloroflexota bacterium]MBV9597092.1 ABC transporter permease [Chloroflexota bacterium]
MLLYILKRLLHGIFVLFGISIIVFGLTWLTGDPASVLLPLNTPPDQVAQFRHQMGLDQPVPLQYLEFVGRAAHGDFGTSFRNRTAALPLVLGRLPMTLALMGAALLFAMLVAVPLGIVAALFHRRMPDFLARFVALLGQSVAAPWLGVMLILLFAVNLRWLPSSGAATPQSIILPAIVAGAYSAAGLTRLLRSSLLEVMANDYVRTALAKGLPTRLVVLRHALKNAAIPVVAFLGIQIAFLFGNTVIAEAIFAYPGMSRLAVDAISARDTPVIQVFVLLAGAVVVLVNLAADVTYAWLDPRIRLA